MTKARKPAPKAKRRSKAKAKAKAPRVAKAPPRRGAFFQQPDDMVPRIGRPRYEPTDKDREWVRLTAGLGMAQHEMAMILRIDIKTLAKHFRQDIDEGKAEVLTSVGAALYRKAMDKTVSGASVRAAEIILKRDRRWLEARHPKDEGDDTRDDEMVIKGGLPERELKELPAEGEDDSATPAVPGSGAPTAPAKPAG